MSHLVFGASIQENNMKKYLPKIIATAILLGITLLFATTVFAATFGNTGDNASVQTNSTDRKYVYSATPASSGTVTAGAARIWNGGTLNSPTHLVIYSDVAGVPTTLLAVSDDVTINTGTSEAEVAYTFSGINQIAIVSGVPYWIGVHFTDPGTGNMSISRANTVGLVRSDPDTYSDGSSATCSCATSSNGGLDVYITYTEAGGGGATSVRQSVIWFE
jgi:hypothetical protein